MHKLFSYYHELKLKSSTIILSGGYDQGNPIIANSDKSYFGPYEDTTANAISTNHFNNVKNRVRSMKYNYVRNFTKSTKYSIPN